MYFPIPNTRVLIFSHLYDEKWAVLEKPRNRWGRPKIIFPVDFQPQLGKKYECVVTKTSFGTFVYNDTEFDLCHARLSSSEAAGIIEVIDYLFKPKESLGSLGTMMENPDIRENLPEKREIVTLGVQADLRNGGYMFKPEYRDSDSEADGKLSMRFFHLTNGNKMDYRIGERVPVRVTKVSRTSKINSRGAVILNVYVEPLPKRK